MRNLLTGKSLGDIAPSVTFLRSTNGPLADVPRRCLGTPLAPARLEQSVVAPTVLAASPAAVRGERQHFLNGSYQEGLLESSRTGNETLLEEN
jgi:hypothetical protein